MPDLKALMLTLDAMRGACTAILHGHRHRAAVCLADAAASADKAFPPGTKESFALAMVQCAITEAAGRPS